MLKRIEQSTERISYYYYEIIHDDDKRVRILFESSNKLILQEINYHPMVIVLIT